MEYCNVYLKIAAPNSPATGTMNGDIVFTPDNERGSVWSEGRTITPSAPVRCELSNGVLMYNGSSKVQLMAGGGGVNPEKVYWRVAFENITLGEEQVQIDPFVFEAIPGETIDLARVTPVMGYTPPGVIRGAAGLKFLGVVDSASDLPSSPSQGDAYVNIVNKSIFIWNGSKWEEIEDFASVDGNVETFNTVLTRAYDAAERAESAAEEAVQQVEGDFATRNYVDESKYFRGYATQSHTLDTMPEGVYHVASGTVATSLGLPRVATGWLEVFAPAGTSNTRRVTFKPVISGTRNAETWEISTSVSGGSLSSGTWARTEDNYAGALTTSDFYQNLPPGKYSAISGTVSLAAGIPTARGGYLKIETGLDTYRSVEFKTNNPGTGDKQYTLSTETTAGNAWHGNWFVTNQHRLRSSPIVLTQPALSTMVSDKANYRQSQRIAFTCPTNVERVRVHISARNYRTGTTWGGMTLRGVGIGEQTTGGQVRNLRTFESAKNAVIPTDGSDWVSEWETSYLSPGSTYLLTYGCDWTTAPGDMGILSGTNWSNARSEAWDEDGSSSGWVRLSLQPLDIWIECLAPSDVPVYSYFGTSLTMGMDSGESVFSSYPQVHARMNGAFCAQTSAGGWAVVDDSAQDPDVINRFGKAGESEKVYALWGGSNDVNARGATVAEVAAAIEVWSNHAKRYLKGSQYLQTTSGGLRYTGPDDPGWLNIEAMNEWLRTEGWLLPNISGVLDIHNLFTKPSEWWSQNSLFAYSDTNGHFNVAGHKRYAMALDSGFSPKREIGEGVLAAYNQGKGL